MFHQNSNQISLCFYIFSNCSSSRILRKRPWPRWKNPVVVSAQPEVAGRKREERREREREKKEKCPARTLNDASLWPFGSLMVVRHANLRVPSVPFPSAVPFAYLSLFVYLSLYQATPLAAPFARLWQIPTIVRRISLPRRKGAALASKSRIISTLWGLLGLFVHPPHPFAEKRVRKHFSPEFGGKFRYISVHSD